MSYNDKIWHSYALSEEDLKMYKSRDTLLDFCCFQHFSPEISNFCCIKKYRYRLFGSLKVALINMVAILIMSAKLATLDLLKMKVFWNKGYDVIIFIHRVTNKILLRLSNCIVDVVTWPKFVNSAISMRQVIMTRKSIFFEGLWVFLVQVHYFGSGTRYDLAKELKLKVRRFLGLTLTFVETTGENLHISEYKYIYERVISLSSNKYIFLILFVKFVMLHAISVTFYTKNLTRSL